MGHPVDAVIYFCATNTYPFMVHHRYNKEPQNLTFPSFLTIGRTTSPPSKSPRLSSVSFCYRDCRLESGREDIQNFLGTLRMLVRNFGSSQFHSFVSCFCQSGNLLSQWRAYADKGGGYCIGFDFSEDVVVTPDPEIVHSQNHSFSVRSFTTVICKLPL